MAGIVGVKSAPRHAAEMRVIPVPPVFDLAAAEALEQEVRAAPVDAEVGLDFGAVQTCQAFVLARLLSRIAALGRTGSTTLLSLNRNQQRLLHAGGLSAVIPGRHAP